MNTITDLTARAVSFITTIQTVLLKGSILSNQEEKLSILTIVPNDFTRIINNFVLFDQNGNPLSYKRIDKDSFAARAVELVWVSAKAPDVQTAINYTIVLSQALVVWIQDNKKMQKANIPEHYGTYPTPFVWREIISKILYEYPEERVTLANALQYLPIRIVLALGAGKQNSRKQRILQMWNIENDFKMKLLNKREIKNLDHFTEATEKSEHKVGELLTEDRVLFSRLYDTEVPFSFETIFKSELEEIRRNRAWREREEYITAFKESVTIKPKDKSDIKDPFVKAKEMNLLAITFSGGGIRSATFNLGILQGLSRKNLVNKFDYMSTVSGGGYIGSWLATWIKRDQSTVKVTNRLCPDKSPEPLGEELKPIRWLRMFSNYFAPDASIMSVDSWTIGVTWLRNTLINQIIIFVLLLGLLFTGNLLYEIWKDDLRSYISYSWQPMLWLSISLLTPVAVLAGLGMHAYHSEGFPSIGVKRKGTKTVSIFLWIIALIGAYFLSAWISSCWNIDVFSISSLPLLWPIAAASFAALFIVSRFGQYYKCIMEFTKTWKLIWSIIYAQFFLLLSALISISVGLLCLVAMWTILNNISTSIESSIVPIKDELQFILGVPMALEVFSITVVARMAFLGKYFPDERREWWGRMGAYIHRIAFIWICISASALLGNQFVSSIFEHWWTALPATGGWVALVWSAVKAAFSSKTSGKEEDKSSLSTYLNILSLVGPYLFILGLLVFLPGLIEPIRSWEEDFIKNHIQASGYMLMPKFQILLIIILCAIIVFILCWRIGVNEFSMHHFYRNRLVRAYLGASRRSTNRQITYNPFTGFDMLDDEKLYAMRYEHGYHGPYPILNTALNASDVVDLDRQDRKAESFIFSPLYCGFDFSMIKASADVSSKSYDYAYRETQKYAYKDNGPSIGTAMAISGAAVNPNQGYHSSAATAFLLTVFNLQMGWWIGNPRQSTWQRSDPRFGLSQIFYNLIGKTNTTNNYVALSDGGHFDNMGLYEMIRRKCSRVVVCDAEQDTDFSCEGFANAIRRCRIDFGAEIDINISRIVNRKDNKYSGIHWAIGDITYAGSDKPNGKLLYIKSSLTGDEPVDVYEYAFKNPSFPQQSTADQFFDEEQFESYRKLGLHIIDTAMNNNRILQFFS